MKRRDAFELYTNYLLASPKTATATDLSKVLDGALKHDYISDFLGEKSLDSKAYWKEIKSFVRKIEKEEGVLSIDDVIVEKPHSTVNEIVNYHFDHTKNRIVVGINILNFLLSSENEGQIVNCPIAFEIIKKTIKHIDKKGKERFKSEKTKNELVVETLHRLVFSNEIKFKYILFDSWFSASKSLSFIHKDLEKLFVCPLKSNRLVAFSKEDKLNGKFIHVRDIDMSSKEVKQVWVKGLDFPVNLVKQVFKNKNGSEATQCLITNDMEINHDEISMIYQKRWKVEELHKSLKQNTLIGKSPTKMEVSQSNHIFSSMIAFVKLERVKIKEKLNHFALKSKLYIKMIKVAFQEVFKMQS